MLNGARHFVGRQPPQWDHFHMTGTAVEFLDRRANREMIRRRGVRDDGSVGFVDFEPRRGVQAAEFLQGCDQFLRIQLREAIHLHATQISLQRTRALLLHIQQLDGVRDDRHLVGPCLHQNAVAATIHDHPYGLFLRPRHRIRAPGSCGAASGRLRLPRLPLLHLLHLLLLLHLHLHLLLHHLLLLRHLLRRHPSHRRSARGKLCRAIATVVP